MDSNASNDTNKMETIQNKVNSFGKECNDISAVDKMVCNDDIKNTALEQGKEDAHFEKNESEGGCTNTFKKVITGKHTNKDNECDSKKQQYVNEDNTGNTENTENTQFTKERVTVKKEIGPDGKWIVRTYTGYIVTLTVNPDKDRPNNFTTERAEMMWDTAIEINLSRLKHQIKTGEYCPDDAVIEVDPNPLKPPDDSFSSYSGEVESEEKRRDNVEGWKRKKINILERELELIELTLNVREHFTGEHQMYAGLFLLKKMLTLDVTPLMLKKNPFVVNTIFCLRSYSGANEQSEINDVSIIQDVKTKAEEIYEKFKSLFPISSKSSFEEYFKEQSVFMWRILGFDACRTYEFVNDPAPMV